MDASALPASRSQSKRLTRKRIPLSCIACRLRKLKCNREKPCQNCLVRDAATCTYSEKLEDTRGSKANPRSNADNMRKRLTRLESSILTVMSGEGLEQTNPRVFNNFKDVDVYDQAGGQKLSMDTRSTHWDAILHELGAIKEAWTEDDDDAEDATDLGSFHVVHRPSFLTGLATPPEIPEVLAALPNKATMDQLVDRFFGHYNPSQPTKWPLHKPTFLKEYSQYWKDPTKTKVIWLGILFSVLCHALQSYQRSGQTPPNYYGDAIADATLYRIQAGHCLTIADIRRPVKYMIEALLLYSMAEYSDENDGDMGSCLLSGHMVRIALHQGFHRDPSQHTNISVFDGEMRRRIWAFLIQHEILFSAKIGIPKYLNFSEFDTDLPRNIYDEEFSEETTVLPPSRPMTEPSPMSYFLTKYRIISAYGHVLEHLHNVHKQPSYEDVMRLDALLHDARNAIPPHLQLRPLELMAHEPPSVLMERYLLMLFYHKALCLLHRKNWNLDLVGHNSIAYSRRICVASSMALLNMQVEMHQACQPGGVLVEMKWYHFAITNHDFLLAAVIVCLDMMERDTRGSDMQSGYAERYGAIVQSRTIWAEITGECKDARRATRILDQVLIKLDELQASGVPVPVSPQSLCTHPERGESPYDINYLTNDYRPSQRLPPPLYAAPGFAGNNEMFGSSTLLNSLGNSVEALVVFDWDAWDQILAAHPQN